MQGFAVTYEIVTEESSREGDAAKRGFLGQDMTFRDAITLFNDERDRTYVEADCYPMSPDNPPRWFTDYGESNWGNSQRSVSLHLPDGISGHSAMRIARLVGCYGSN